MPCALPCLAKSTLMLMAMSQQLLFTTVLTLCILLLLKYVSKFDISFNIGSASEDEVFRNVWRTCCTIGWAWNNGEARALGGFEGFAASSRSSERYSGRGGIGVMSVR